MISQNNSSTRNRGRHNGGRNTRPAQAGQQTAPNNQRPNNQNPNNQANGNGNTTITANSHRRPAVTMPSPVKAIGSTPNTSCA